MRSNRALLWVQRMYANVNAVQAVGKFARYIHYRDPIDRGESGEGLQGLVSYVAHHDRAVPGGRLFIRTRAAGDPERRALVRFVRRSLEAVPAHVLERKFSGVPAAYRFVLGPEDARGLDLRRLTREVMRQLEREAGGLPPWIAAEHRNTAHPHTHILMAAHREVAPGQFRKVVVTPGRLARMKAALSREIELQRGERQPGAVLQPRSERRGVRRERAPARTVPQEPLRNRRQSAQLLAAKAPFRHRREKSRRSRGVSWYPIQTAFARLAAHYRRQLELEARQLRRSGREAADEREWEMYE